MPVKCIIFDFGRVLGNFDHMLACRRLADYSPFPAKRIYETVFEGTLNDSLERGLDSGRFYHKALRALQIRPNNLGFSTFHRVWGDIFSENPGVEAVLEKLRPGVRKVLLSNTNKVHWQYMQRLPVIERFFPAEHANLVLSFERGFRKPHPELFRQAIRQGGSSASETAYIDDVPEYVEAFRELGGNGAEYNCSRDPLGRLESVLKEWNVLK